MFIVYLCLVLICVYCKSMFSVNLSLLFTCICCKSVFCVNPCLVFFCTYLIYKYFNLNFLQVWISTCIHDSGANDVWKGTGWNFIKKVSKIIELWRAKIMMYTWRFSLINWNSVKFDEIYFYNLQLDYTLNPCKTFYMPWDRWPVKNIMFSKKFCANL